jgi:hypothetical protein
MVQTTADRIRRREFIGNVRGAVHQGTTTEAREAKRAQRSDDWTEWLHRKMFEMGIEDPACLLPDVCAKLEQIIDDRVAERVNELKGKLRKVLT